MSPSFRPAGRARAARAAGAVLFVTCLLAATAPRPSHAGPCAPNALDFRQAGVFTSSAAAYDTTHATYGDRLAYDLVAGVLELATCCTFATTSLETFDAYDVVGVPPGTPVDFTVELRSVGEIYDVGHCGGSGCAGLFGAAILHGDRIEDESFTANLFDGARATFDFTVGLPVTLVAGAPETIRFRLWARRAPGGSHGETGTGTIRFTTATAGAAVVSCYGYAGPAIPARPASWGWVKSTYR